jgi:hypothetical protein
LPALPHNYTYLHPHTLKHSDTYEHPHLDHYSHRDQYPLPFVPHSYTVAHAMHGHRELAECDST